MPVPVWLQQCIDDVNELSKQLTACEESAAIPASGDIRRDLIDLDQRARAYSFEVAGWLQKVETPGPRDIGDPRAILAYDCAVIPARICRAMAARERHAGPGEPAILALRSLERSRAAWIIAVERRLASATEIARFLSELEALRNDLERLFPTE